MERVAVRPGGSGRWAITWYQRASLPWRLRTVVSRGHNLPDHRCGSYRGDARTLERGFRVDRAVHAAASVFRVLLSSTAAIDPFLFLYAVTRLGAPVTKIGDYVILGVLGWVVSAPIWFWVEHRSGARTLLQSAAVVRLIAPAIALATPPLAAIGLIQERLSDATALTTTYGAAFFVVGAALAGQSRGNYDYLAALAPHSILPAYTGLTNAILAIVAFSPVLGGVVIERFGYEALFGAAAAIGLVTVFAGGLLAETPSRARERQDAEHAANTKALLSGSA
jgi:hypothetical protein